MILVHVRRLNAVGMEANKKETIFVLMEQVVPGIINIETNNYKCSGYCDANNKVSVNTAVTAGSIILLTAAQVLNSMSGIAQIFLIRSLRSPK